MRDLIFDEKDHEYRRMGHGDLKSALQSEGLEVAGIGPQTHHLAIFINQQFFITEGGLIGLGPHESCVGDEVWVLHGAGQHYILRDVPNHEKRVYYIGEAYVQGIMDGEAVPDGTKDEFVTLV